MKPNHESQFLVLSLALSTVWAHALPPMITAKAVLDRSADSLDRMTYSCSGYGTEVTDFLSTILSPELSFDFKAFCSDFLQSTEWNFISKGTTSLAYDHHLTTTIWPTTTTTIYGSAGTTTELCPTALPNMRCDLGTWRYPDSSPPISSFDLLEGKTNFTDIWSCHQLCLVNPSCKSWYVDDWQSWQWNLRQNDEPESLKCVGLNATIPQQFTVFSAGGDIAPTTVFDRNCQNFLPDACSTSSSAGATATPTVSQAPAIVSAVPTPVRRDIESWSSTPAYMQSVYPLIPYWACSCIITAPSPVRTITSHVASSYYITYITNTYTRHHTKTVHANLSTTTLSVL